MIADMTPPPIMDDAPAIMVTDQKSPVQRLIVSSLRITGRALIVLMRDGRVDPDMAIDAITRAQNQASSNASTAIVAFVESIFR